MTPKALTTMTKQLGANPTDPDLSLEWSTAYLDRPARDIVRQLEGLPSWMLLRLAFREWREDHSNGVEPGKRRVSIARALARELLERDEELSEELSEAVKPKAAKLRAARQAEVAPFDASFDDFLRAPVGVIREHIVATSLDLKRLHRREQADRNRKTVLAAIQAEMLRREKQDAAVCEAQDEVNAALAAQADQLAAEQTAKATERAKAEAALETAKDRVAAAKNELAEARSALEDAREVWKLAGGKPSTEAKWAKLRNPDAWAVRCSHCGAKAGQPCRRPNGQADRRWNHRARNLAWERRQARKAVS